MGLSPPRGAAEASKMADARLRYVSSDLGLSFHSLPKGTPEDIASVLSLSTPSLGEKRHNSKAEADVVAMISKALTSLSEVAGRTLTSPVLLACFAPI